MGKITFRRLTVTLVRSKINATLPVIGSGLFLVGSLYFWPDDLDRASDGNLDMGASLFVAGSALYMIAPLLDYADMSLALSEDLARKPDEPGVGSYERLYKAQIVRSQRANALLFACGGTCFFAGSFLFFPEERMGTTHGAWLYLVGCVLSFLAGTRACACAHPCPHTGREDSRQACPSTSQELRPSSSALSSPHGSPASSPVACAPRHAHLTRLSRAALYELRGDSFPGRLNCAGTQE